jgi:hypothetical protein
VIQERQINDHLEHPIEFLHCRRADLLPGDQSAAAAPLRARRRAPQLPPRVALAGGGP